MHIKPILSSFLIVVVLSCSAKRHISITGLIKHDSLTTSIKIDTLTLLDSSRNRQIPIALYNYKLTKAVAKRKQKLAIINPGYGGTKMDYGFIAKKLVEYGYFVVTIQHDLPSDAPIQGSGNIRELRQPFWDAGVKSVLYVLTYLKHIQPGLDYKNLVLIGHSNGGDISMLIANEYPKLACTVISLDNRRVAFPRASHPKIFSIRSSDQPADEGVLPTAEEQKKYNIRIVKVNTIHNDMGGMGTATQLQEINTYILDFLNVKKS
jgi:hypothetical protein